MGKVKKGKLDSLFPIPGSKRASKYSFLRPNGQSRICEPFMGGAAVSLITGLPTVLGEINASQAAIACASKSVRSRAEFIADYNQTRADFLAGVDVDLLVSYASKEQAQKLLAAEMTEVYALLADRWKAFSSQLFADIASGNPRPGAYAFRQRAAFGNVMRFNPRGSAFNSSWHVCKLKNAVAFDPEWWCNQLVTQGWQPNVQPSWQAALNSVTRPQDCYLLLDPPYLEGEGDRKMTPCYLNHQVTTTDGRSSTFALSVNPLALALESGFPLIHLTNYYSATLDEAVTAMALEAGYLCDRQMLGVCGALGNSAGRLTHGQRVDARPKPIEAVWTFQPFRQLNFFGVAA